MGKFSYHKMKRPGKLPDLLTLALHGPSTFDEIELPIVYHIFTHLSNFGGILTWWVFQGKPVTLRE